MRNAIFSMNMLGVIALCVVLTTVGHFFGWDPGNPFSFWEKIALAIFVPPIIIGLCFVIARR
jgi:hypothetical protein